MVGFESRQVNRAAGATTRVASPHRAGGPSLTAADRLMGDRMNWAIAKEIIRWDGVAVWMALMSLILLLGAVSAINKVRRGQWYAAGGIFLPIFGANVMLFGGVERHSQLLFWLGLAFAVVGFGMEFIALQRARRSVAL